MRAIEGLEEGGPETKAMFCGRQEMLFDEAKEDFWTHHNDAVYPGFLEYIQNILGLSDSMSISYELMLGALDRMTTLSTNIRQAGC